MAEPEQPDAHSSARPDDGTVVQGQPEMAQTKSLSSPDVDLGGLEGTEPASPEQLGRSGALAIARPRAAGYELIRPLGSGAFGQVWLAREEGTPIEVAVKFFSHGTGDDWKRLQEEVQQLAMLDSVPGIVPLKDVCADAQPPYFVMAYAPKGSLADRLARGPLPLAEALDIFRRVAAALDYVHAKGIRHCDLKPANILLDARGHPLIADFGQAHLSSDASPVLGTFFYMAPEQADLSKQIPDTRWDVYGLGALLYAMLTGRPPRENAELREQMKATAELSHRLRRYREWILKAPAPRAHRKVCGVDRPLAQVIERCLEVEPHRRHPNAGAVLAALKLRERRRRRRPLLIFGLIAPLLLLAVVAWGDFSTNETTLRDAEAKLSTQLLDSDRNSARLIANAVQENMSAHLGLLRNSVNPDPASRDAKDLRISELLAARDVPALKDALVHFMERSRRVNFKFSQAAVADHEGRVLAIINLKDGQLVERDPDMLDCKQFDWRDWFSGEGDHWDEMNAPHATHQPITGPHVSDPYISLPDRYMFVNLSVPVGPPGKPDDPPIGVLTASVKLDDINQWLVDVDMKDGFAVLLDKRRFCLLHKNRETIQPLFGQAARHDFDFSPLDHKVETDRAAARSEGKSGEAVSGALVEYHDPVDGATYLAGYARMPDEPFGWTVVVQHDRAAVLEPIDDLREKLWGAGWRMIGLAGMMTLFLWCWLFWTLRRTER